MFAYIVGIIQEIIWKLFLNNSYTHPVSPWWLIKKLEIVSSWTWLYDWDPSKHLEEWFFSLLFEYEDNF